MKKSPLVSILMNCYNEEQLISRAIKSVLKQTYKNFELLIWDDASDDNTKKIINLFNDKRIKFFKNKKHLGLGSSRCKAQNKIHGELVAILDADDAMIPTRIAKQVDAFIKNKKLALVSSWIKFIDVNGATIPDNFTVAPIINRKLNKNKLKENMAWRNVLAHSSIMYKKKEAKKVGWYSNKLEYAQDYDLSVRLIKDYECKILPERLTLITSRKESMTKSAKLKKKKIQENLYILKKCRSQFIMSNRVLFLNSSSIKMHELKLKLAQNINIIIKFFIVIKTLLQSPSLLSFHFLKKNA